MAIDWSHQDSSPLRAALAELTELLVGEESLQAVLQRVVFLACSGIGACDLASVTYMRHAAPETIVFTDPVANAIDQAQYGADLGPCLDAFRRREVVSVPSMVSADRWPAFRDAALAHDVRSSLSLPLVTGEAHIGALNLYGRQDQAFNAVPPEAATLFARQAAAAVWVADTIASTRAMIGHLEVAVESRDMIGMAKGIIMVNEKVTPDAAFILLQTASQHRNVKLRDIAAEVVETGLTPS